MKLNYKPATRKGQTMRTAIFGASGSGKTPYALEIANVLTDGHMSRVLLIDTENESAGLYVDNYDEPFQCYVWEGPHDPADLADAIHQADIDPNLDVIIVDGLSPFWSGKGGMLDLVTKYSPKGNAQAGWGKANNHENDLREQIVNTKSHFITTMRAKPLSGEDPDPSLNTVGMKPDQRATVFYEFNTVLYVAKDHSAEIVKARCMALDERHTFPNIAAAKDYAEIELNWLNDNTKYLTAAEVDTLKNLFEQIETKEQRSEAKREFIDQYGSPEHLSSELEHEARQFITSLIQKYNTDPFLDDQPADLEAFHNHSMPYKNNDLENDYLDEEAIQNG